MLPRKPKNAKRFKVEKLQSFSVSYFFVARVAVDVEQSLACCFFRPLMSHANWQSLSRISCFKLPSHLHHHSNPLSIWAAESRTKLSFSFEIHRAQFPFQLTLHVANHALTRQKVESFAAIRRLEERRLYLIKRSSAWVNGKAILTAS